MRLLVAAALAFIPSTSALLQRAASRGEGAKAREVTLTGSLETGGVAEPAKLVIRTPLQCRLDGDTGLIAAVKASATAPGTSEEGSAPDPLSLLRLACPMISYRGLGAAAAGEALTAVAARNGVDVTSQTAFGRLADRVVYILGAQPREAGKPQFWLYKDNGAPARLITQDGSDLRLLEYGSPAAAEWFPRVIELWRDGKQAARFQIFEVKGMKGGAEGEDDNGD